MYYIGAIMVYDEVVGMMLAALLILMDFLHQVIHYLVAQEVEGQVGTKQRHGPPLFVVHGLVIGGQLPAACNTRNEVILEIDVRPLCCVILYTVLEPVPFGIGVVVVFYFAGMYHTGRVACGNEFHAASSAREMTGLVK